MNYHKLNLSQGWDIFTGGEQGFRSAYNSLRGTSPRFGRMMSAIGDTGISGWGGRRLTRFGTGIALGAFAVGNARNMVDRFRNGEIGSATLSAGMAAAAGYGAYYYSMVPGALSRHLKGVATSAMVLKGMLRGLK